MAALALAIPVAGVAGSKKPRVGASVPQSLLTDAAANPKKLFKVIVTGSKGQSSDHVGQQVNDGINADNQVGSLGSNGNNGGNHENKVNRKFRSITGASATLTGKQILWLAKSSDVQSVVPDAPVGMMGDYQNAEMWRDSTTVSSLWSKPAVACPLDTLTGLVLDPTCIASPGLLAPQAPAIAIVDSGIDSSKAADFGSRIVASTNFVSSEPGVTGDPNGHGTMVAGVAAGASPTYPGVAQNAPLVDVRVASSVGMATTSDIIAGLDWILVNKAQYGIRVVNMSLAGSTETSILLDPLDQAVEKLWLNGLTVVAAAGNHGQPNAPVGMPSPGNDPFIITVGALDANQTTTPSDDFRAPWSAYGYTADGFLKPEITAPGRWLIMPSVDGSYIQSREADRVVAPGYIWMSGTSFASPAVAGAAAQLLALHPDWSPDQVKGALMVSASPLASGDLGTGFGELNAAAAAAVASPPNPNENLNAFVQADPVTGLNAFVSANWVSTVSTSANWTSANWTSANWTSANWVSANWVSANWVSANWVSANWVSGNWVAANWVSANWVF
jgi:serine protease AprX